MPSTPRSTLRSRCAATVLAVTLAVAACSDDDDAGDTAPTSGGSTSTVAAPSGTGPAPTTATTAPATTAPVLTEPVVPTLDDTEEIGGSRLYSVDFASGAATSLGPIGGVEVGVLGLAFVPDETSTVYGLTDVPELITFDATDPSTITASVPITGVEGSTLLAIDVSPLDDRLLALSDESVLYAIDPATGTATAIGVGLSEPIQDPGFGFDVDPSTGLVRVEAATGENVLIDPATGAMSDDAGLSPSYDGDSGVTPRVVAIAFGDQLYAIDSATGSLARQDSPDDGVLTTVGPLGIDLTDGASFDISASGQALLAIPG